MYGIGLTALGMLGSLPVALSIDGYGPISDNAGGVAEMTGLPPCIRVKTDALDAAGNTTAAIGKGFAIGSACLVGLALFGAFITRIGDKSVNILNPIPFCGLLMGAMLPYAFSAMTMRAVGDAAFEMMNFIIDDFRRTDTNKKENKKLEDEGQAPKWTGKDISPDYDECIKISTNSSLKEMIAPGILVLGSPILTGFLFGPQAVAGLLAGAIVSGVQVAISASNTGGAWDNCKKEIEKTRAAWVDEIEKKGEAQGKNGEDFVKECIDAWKAHEAEGDDEDSGVTIPDLEKMPYETDEDKMRRDGRQLCVNKELKVAAVVGDTVGDPLKDTSGPAINILIKLSAITSLIFGNYIKENHIWGRQAVEEPAPKTS
jgi:inorganic pyrophosphatase